MELNPSPGIVVAIAAIASSPGARLTNREPCPMSLHNPRAMLHRQHRAAGVKTNVRSSANRFAFSLAGIVVLCGVFPAPALSDASLTSASSHSATSRQFETVEYRLQYGLGLINASAMYARGGTGHGVTVGVLDTGLFRNWDLYSYSFANRKYYWPHSQWSWDRNASDIDGHGTHVAGIIAARKNNIGMHGVAYNARIESLDQLDDSGSGRSDSYLARSINWFANNRGIRIVNHSFGKDCYDDNGNWRGNCLITHVSSSTLYRTFRRWSWSCFCFRTYTDGWLVRSIPAYRSYVGKGGVAVVAAGNDGQQHPTILSGLPYRFRELERGWLAVVAVNSRGTLASYSNRCGVANRWCIAAPGSWILSTSTRSRWNQNRYSSGTSMAAPHVAGALAALKSMFPNLSYQDVRNRILDSANNRGIYSYRLWYGRGLLDLDAASRPMGGTLFPYGGLDDGPTVTTVGAQLTLPALAVSQHIDGEHVLVLDGYQRAPFTVPASAFVDARGGYLSLDDLDLAGPTLSTWDTGHDQSALTISGDDFEVGGISSGRWFVGIGSGAGLMDGFANLLDVPLTHGNYRMADHALGLAMGMSFAAGELRTSFGANQEGDRAGDGWGIAGWSPRSVITASFAPKGVNYAIGASFASNLAKPSGWDGVGAFNLAGDTVDISYGHNIFTGDKIKVEATGRLAHLSPDASTMAHLDDAALAAADVRLSLTLAPNATLNVRWGIEQPLASGEARIRAARTVDESGRLTYKDITMDQADFLKFQKVGLSLRYDPDRNSSYGAGILAVRDGFGETEAIVGARAEIRF